MSTQRVSTVSAPDEAVKRPSFFQNAFELVMFVGNVCGHSPFPFSIVVLLVSAASYLIHVVKEDAPSPLLSGSILLLLYYTFIAIYRLLVYNRYFDPLLAIPGPTVHPPSA
jgi:hypothetical protein